MKLFKVADPMIYHLYLLLYYGSALRKIIMKPYLPRKFCYTFFGYGACYIKFMLHIFIRLVIGYNHTNQRQNTHKHRCQSINYCYPKPITPPFFTLKY